MTCGLMQFMGDSPEQKRLSVQMDILQLVQRFVWMPVHRGGIDVGPDWFRMCVR